MGKQENNQGSLSLENNYFLTKEYAEFMQKITGHKIETFKGFYHIKKKLIGVSYFDDKTKELLKKNKFSFTSIEDGNSLMEYAYLPTKNYDIAKKNYRRGFKIFLKRAQRQNFNYRILNTLTNKELDSIYTIYLEHMKRLNSFQLPKNYFEEFKKLKHSKFVLVYKSKKIIAYTACFDYKNNFYCSTGGTKSENLKTAVMNYMYDKIIEYSCLNKKQLHMGINMSNSGGDYFKKSAGLEFIPAVSHPDNTQFLKIAGLIFKLRLTGIILRAVSKKWPKTLILNLIPLT